MVTGAWHAPTVQTLFDQVQRARENPSARRLAMGLGGYLVQRRLGPHLVHPLLPPSPAATASPSGSANPAPAASTAPAASAAIAASTAPAASVAPAVSTAPAASVPARRECPNHIVIGYSDRDAHEFGFCLGCPCCDDDLLNCPRCYPDAPGRLRAAGGSPEEPPGPDGPSAPAVPANAGSTAASSSDAAPVIDAGEGNAPGADKAESALAEDTTVESEKE